MCKSTCLHLLKARAPPASPLASVLKLESLGMFSIHMSVLNLIFATCAFLTFLLSQSIILHLQEVRIFQFKTKSKGKCPSFLCAFHFSFVDSIPVRFFLFPEMLSSAWNLHQHYFNHSYSPQKPIF